MTKKLSLLLAAVAVVVLAVPAFASAKPEITIGGKKGTENQTLTGTSTNATTLTSLGKIICESVAAHGLVTDNTGTTVRLSGDSAGGNTKGVGCKVGKNTIAVENVALSEFHSDTVGSGDFSASFNAIIGAVHCTFSTAGSTATYVSGASPAVLTLTNVDMVSTPAACEPGIVNGTFTLTSSAGVVVLN